MKVNGYILKNAIENRQIELEAAVSTLVRSVSGSEGSTPHELMEKIEKFETNISKLQGFQSQYNVSVTIDCTTEKISMAEAVKRFGSLKRTLKQWELVFAISQASDVKKPIDFTLAKERIQKLSIEISTLRRRMTVANSTEIDISDLEESLIS